MFKQNRILVLALALICANAEAAKPKKPISQREAHSADLMAPQLHRSAKHSKRYVAGATEVTEADVGDVDSFGRNLHWIGLASANVILSSDCSAFPPGPSTMCQTLNPAPLFTSFTFDDVSRIKLPKNAAHSLLCYWWSPVLNINYQNPTAAPVVARLNYLPTLTVENSVLDDPTLIDPTTGTPFGGSLLTSMTSSERFEVPLPAGVGVNERTRDSAVCIAGFISRKALEGTYGLTPAQATEFFKRETTVRINIVGGAQYVDNANMTFGFRIIGD